MDKSPPKSCLKPPEDSLIDKRAVKSCSQAVAFPKNFIPEKEISLEDNEIIHEKHYHSSKFMSMTSFGLRKTETDQTTDHDKSERFLKSRDSIKLLRQGENHKNIIRWPNMKKFRETKFKAVFLMRLNDSNEKVTPNLKSQVTFNEFSEGVFIDNGYDGWNNNPKMFRLLRRSHCIGLCKCCFNTVDLIAACCKSCRKKEVVIDQEKIKYFYVQSENKIVPINVPSEEGSVMVCEYFSKSGSKELLTDQIGSDISAEFTISYQLDKMYGKRIISNESAL